VEPRTKRRAWAPPWPYDTIFSVAPLMVIAIAIAGLFFGRECRGKDQLRIQGLIGSESARAVQTMIQSAHKLAHGVLAPSSVSPILLIGASGVFTKGRMRDRFGKVDTTPTPAFGTSQV